MLSPHGSAKVTSRAAFSRSSSCSITPPTRSEVTGKLQLEHLLKSWRDFLSIAGGAVGEAAGMNAPLSHGTPKLTGTPFKLQGWDPGCRPQLCVLQDGSWLGHSSVGGSCLLAFGCTGQGWGCVIYFLISFPPEPVQVGTPVRTCQAGRSPHWPVVSLHEEPTDTS